MPSDHCWQRVGSRRPNRGSGAARCATPIAPSRCKTHLCLGPAVATSRNPPRRRRIQAAVAAAGLAVCAAAIGVQAAPSISASPVLTTSEIGTLRFGETATLKYTISGYPKCPVDASSCWGDAQAPSYAQGYAQVFLMRAASGSTAQLACPGMFALLVDCSCDGNEATVTFTLPQRVSSAGPSRVPCMMYGPVLRSRLIVSVERVIFRRSFPRVGTRAHLGGCGLW